MAADIAIVGAGVIGCAIAHALARTGANRILVIDRGEPGAEASNAAAGLLAVASSRAPRGVLFELRRASSALFPALAEELRAELGIDVEYRDAGLLELAFTETEAEELVALVTRRREQGFVAEWLDARAVRELEPGVSPAVCGGAVFADDRAVNSERFVQALHRAAAARGVEFRFGTALAAVETARGRLVSLTAGEERLTPRWLVIAAGAWSADIGGLLRVKVPVRPDKGEMAAVRPEIALRHTIVWNDGYLIPRRDGEVLIGSTSTRGATDQNVSAEALALLLGRAAHMVPALTGATPVRTWAGLRPCSTIRRPIIGPLRGYDNVLLATGHHRSGILLAPITGQLVAELIVHGQTSIPLQPFGYRPR